MATIFFDMDGTIADLYGVENWLGKLRASDASPYEEATPLLRLCSLARILNILRASGYHLGIISWTSKSGTEAFNEATAEAKLKWLSKHLPSVHWDEIHIVPYGTPKENFANKYDVLFDDEEKNRSNWLNDFAFKPEEMLKILKGMK